MPDMTALVAEFRAAHTRYADACDDHEEWVAAREVIGIATELVDILDGDSYKETQR